jgi:hypothetical protein
MLILLKEPFQATFLAVKGCHVGTNAGCARRAFAQCALL